MWAVLWNAWYFGHETKIDEYLAFCWPTDNVPKWKSHIIFHNAGVLGGGGNMFYKGDYIMSLPYNMNLTFDKCLCSANYANEIVELKDKSALI